MTIAEYAIARRVHQLEERVRNASKMRPLTPKERAFLRRVEPLMERLRQEEQK